ncbi:MAG: PilT/PilU family type 4a pilus ATPase [Candidatus Eisenbacteria bacterium]|uniref:PilT/PilU family type 4a pilus ATPase n=1 Tax=Eiseniibacteriota bacterium TaxID=2212470 RepID=A0A956LZ97_UNCEI|nr:PilT/PilU family type 4a pilus ATPase [Candidatus Eisenbacteria bacterium]
MARIDAFLELGRQQGCSDIHFTVGLPPLVRIDGDLSPVQFRSVEADEMRSMLAEVMDETHKQDFKRRGAVDISYAVGGLGRFRINVLAQQKGPSAVCRVIPDKIVPLAKLGLPAMVASLADLPAGLVLVTGACGTGKSSTLAAIVDEINRRRKVTVLTLENPIEFLHESNEALVIQREVGTHCRTFAEGLRSALRQDPDVIVVTEMSDEETIRLALEASETGHLVLATLHTRGAAPAIDRILDAFPQSAHAQIRVTLAENLRCVLYQELVRAADGRGRRAAVEILTVNPAVSQHIREGRTFQIASVMATGRRFGMQQMDQALLALVRAEEVDPAHAFLLAKEKAEFRPYLRETEGLELLMEL